MTNMPDWLHELQAFLAAPTTERAAALAPYLADDLELAVHLTHAVGKETALPEYAASRFPEIITGGAWGDPVDIEKGYEFEISLPPRAMAGGYTFRAELNDAQRLASMKVVRPHKPQPLAPSPIVLDDRIRQLLDQALAVGSPAVLAYVDGDRPRQSFRGSVHVHTSHDLAFWNRDPAGSFLRAIQRNANVSLAYRHAESHRAYYFSGTARVEPAPEERDRIYAESPQAERNADRDRRGVAVVVDLSRVEGLDMSTAGGWERILMARLDEQD